MILKLLYCELEQILEINLTNKLMPHLKALAP